MKLILESWRRYLKEFLDEPISKEDVHDLADKLNIPWDDDAEFMRWTKEVTKGKSHLDKMTSEELLDVYTALEKRGITKLRVFDFDDTLTHATARIVVRDTETGEEIRTLDQGELDTYEEKEGEELDFSEFKAVPEETKPIEEIIKIFRNMVEHPDKDRKVMIITARMTAAESEIEDYLKNLDIDIGDVEIVGTEGKSKAPYVQRELEGLPNVNNFIMFDDSEKNLKDVREMMEEDFPNIKVELRQPKIEDGSVRVPIFRDQRDTSKSIADSANYLYK